MADISRRDFAVGATATMGAVALFVFPPEDEHAAIPEFEDMIPEGGIELWEGDAVQGLAIFEIEKAVVFEPRSFDEQAESKTLFGAKVACPVEPRLRVHGIDYPLPCIFGNPTQSALWFHFPKGINV